MISLFAMNVLNKAPDTSLKCSFVDMRRELQELQNAAQVACQLGIMGIDKAGNISPVFNANGYVTNAQFGTMLSRLLRGSRYDLDAEEYYSNHFAALKRAKILIESDNPKDPEMIGNIFIVLMRAANIK